MQQPKQQLPPVHVHSTLHPLHTQLMNDERTMLCAVLCSRRSCPLQQRLSTLHGGAENFS